MTNNADYADTPTVRVTRYSVNAVPETVPDYYAWEITVEYRGKGRWAVMHLSECLSRSGKWDYEPKITVNGYTPTDLAPSGSSGTP